MSFLECTCIVPRVLYQRLQRCQSFHFIQVAHQSSKFKTTLNSLHAMASCIINIPQPSPGDACLAKSNLLPISYFYIRSVLILMHKVHFEPSCLSICKLFSKRKIYGSEFRIQNQFDVIIRFNSDTGRNTLQYRDPVIWDFLNRLVTVNDRF